MGESMAEGARWWVGCRFISSDSLSGCGGLSVVTRLVVVMVYQ